MKYKKHIQSALIISICSSCILSATAIAKDETSQIEVSSESFTTGGTIPREYTADGKDISPQLSWSDPPAGTKSLALTCEDPDAPAGTWFHWIIFNISPETKKLKENMEKTKNPGGGIAQGANDFNKIGYNGPSPPKGPVHHYNFKLFALNSKLKLKPGCSKEEFYKAIKGKILGEGKVTGIYQRK